MYKILAINIQDNWTFTQEQENLKKIITELSGGVLVKADERLKQLMLEVALQGGGESLRQVFATLNGLEFLKAKSPSAIETSNPNSIGLWHSLQNFSKNPDLIFSKVQEKMLELKIFYTHQAKENGYLGDEMMEAAKNCDVDKLEAYLNQGADLEYRNTESQFTPFREVVFRGSLQLVNRQICLEAAKLLIKYGADFEAKDKFGFKPVSQATICGFNSMVELLIQHGININEQETNGYTILMRAAEKGYKETVELLLAKGAKLNMRNSNRKKAIDIARSEGKMEVVEILKRREQELGSEFLQAAAEGNIGKLKEVLAAGIDVDYQNWVGDTALTKAVENSHMDAVIFLVEEAEADIGVNNKMAIGIAESNEDEEMTFYLKYTYKQDNP